MYNHIYIYIYIYVPCSRLMFIVCPPTGFWDVRYGPSTTILAPSWKTRWCLFPSCRRLLPGFDFQIYFKISLWVTIIVSRVTIPKKPYLRLVNYYNLPRSMYLLHFFARSSVTYCDMSTDVFTVHNIHHIYEHILSWSILHSRCFYNWSSAFCCYPYLYVSELIYFYRRDIHSKQCDT